MTFELKQAIEAAKRNDFQEAILKLCEVVEQLEYKISWLESEEKVKPGKSKQSKKRR
jgi:hypothetical protein